MGALFLCSSCTKKISRLYRWIVLEKFQDYRGICSILRPSPTKPPPKIKRFWFFSRNINEHKASSQAEKYANRLENISNR